MSDERLSRIEALFHAALARPQAERRGFLEVDEPDPDIRDAVLRLLEHTQPDTEGDLEDLIERAKPKARDATDRRIGPYRLLRELGAGGMGTVFLAERDIDGTPRKVALKLLHGMPTESEKRRLARERELLAGLSHPHIAGLIDGGETADGQPFLVMNYIEGQSLSAHIGEHKPALPERLRLFVQCCEAVQHAHQRLILHRDIKPSNIVVNPDGTPVLLDFGVGKPLEDGDPEQTVTPALTPGYAAPEQLHGEAATTATDVFGLGALLFDMLSDTRLSLLRKGDSAVPAPSAHIADPMLRRAVRGDLDRIVLKATAAEPTQRYPTAAALADDVDRFLRGEPLMAGPDAMGYRLRKFIARHRWGVAAGLAAGLVAALFIWRLDTERQRAQQAEAEARRAAASANASRDFLVSTLGSVDPEELQDKPVTFDALLTTAVDKLRNDRSLDPQARALGWLTIAEIYTKIQHPRQVLEAVRRARSAYRNAGMHAPELEARMLELRGSALSGLDRHKEALAQMQALIELRQHQPGNTAQKVLAHQSYAATAARAQRFEPAEAHLQQALELLDGIEDPQHDSLHLKLLLDGLNMHSMMGDYATADRYLQQVRDLAVPLLEPDDPQWQRIHSAAAEIHLNQTRYADALEEAQLAMAITRRVYGENNRRIVQQEQQIASTLYQLGHEQDAIEHLKNARRLSQELQLGDISLAQLDIELATNQIAWGQHQDAIRSLDSALARLPADDPAQSIWRMAGYGLRAGAHAALGQFERAWPDYEQELRLSLEFGPDSFEHAQTQLRYAQTLLDAGRLQESERALETAKRINRAEGIGEDTPAGIMSLTVEAKLQQALGNAIAAREAIDKALQGVRARGGEMAPKSAASVKLAAAGIAFDQGDNDQARRLLQQAFPVMERSLSPDAVQLRKARDLIRKLDGKPRSSG